MHQLVLECRLDVSSWQFLSNRRHGAAIPLPAGHILKYYWSRKLYPMYLRKVLPTRLEQSISVLERNSQVGRRWLVKRRLLTV
jgi:hypothetical protein